MKIGAKSKKDPHIRVGGGQEDGVKAAKARITEVLDTRVNRWIELLFFITLVFAGLKFSMYFWFISDSFSFHLL